MLFLHYRIICLLIIVAACTGTGQLNEAPLEDEDQIDYSLIYVIHGDAGYLYHDNRGDQVRADRRMVDQAIQVGKSNPGAEVFIFHQRPMSHLFYIFPRNESKFYHFRGGRLITEETYTRRASTNLSEEAQLYHIHSSLLPENAKRIFLYYGHEIPEQEGYGYHASLTKTEFNLDILGNGMGYFLDEEENARFDLTVLSTCSNGSPHTAFRLSEQTHYLIASPIDLHLSYMDSQFFGTLHDSTYHDTEKLAKNFAESAFNILASNLQASVGISVYNTDLITEEHDSSETIINDSIISFYREARFGRAGN